MVSDEVRGSLADAVAEWTPPWQRPPTGGTATAEQDAETGAPEAEAVAEAEEPESDFLAALTVQAPPDTPPDTEPEAPADSSDLAEFGAPAPGASAPEAVAVAVADPDPLPAVDDLPGTLEAILMIVDEPVGEIMLAQILDRDAAEITATLERLAAEYTEQARGFDLRRQAGGWRFYTRDDYAAYVERFVLDGQQARLTKAALETLAVVAYKQPVTRARISGIRGVNCDGVIRTLLSRGLVEECGAEPDSGAHLYRTTVLFLEKLGINSINELPPLAPFLPDDLDDLTEGGVDA
ncbi:SMC-Scp complex subunit ScpB [Phytomonospora sp. NPDC050363]|uniref:SMC-Scp complex subunit ScpB n=1 Tax=Phytomonospora sp. NPDC050363 TaxID=3155642 RepID=UPI0033FFE570